jgi:hypothetical protein
VPRTDTARCVRPQKEDRATLPVSPRPRLQLTRQKQRMAWGPRLPPQVATTSGRICAETGIIMMLIAEVARGMKGGDTDE